MPTESPKTRFIKQSGYAKEWADITTRKSFQAAIDFSLLQMGDNEGTANEVTSAACRHYMVAGARHFAHILAHLAEPELNPPTTRPDNLQPET